MAHEIPQNKKRPRGRPRTDSIPVLVRLPPGFVAELDSYIEERALDNENGERMTRPEAIRFLLVTQWLKRRLEAARSGAVIGKRRPAPAKRRRKAG